MQIRVVLSISLGLACQAQRQAGPERPTRPAPRAQVIEHGPPRTIDDTGALAAGYTVVDFSDDFAPFLFAEHALPSGEVVTSHYRRTFVGMANDRLDGDGQPLAPGSKNYLELYGSFLTLRVAGPFSRGRGEELSTRRQPGRARSGGLQPRAPGPQHHRRAGTAPGL